VKDNREKGNTKRKFPELSGSTMERSANKVGSIRKEGEKKKGRLGKLARSVTAGQQK
jgi:hypothetical protein